MAKKQLFSFRTPVLDGVGVPLAGGRANFYLPGTTTPITTYSDSALTVANTAPVYIPADGRISVWVNQDCDILVEDRDGADIYTEESVNPSSATGAFDSGLVANGQFDGANPTNSDVPASWSVDTETGDVTIDLDVSSSVFGTQSPRFTSTGTGEGKLISSDYFEVSEAQDLIVSFWYKSSAASVGGSGSVTVELVCYDSSVSLVSAVEVFSLSAGLPSTFTKFVGIATPAAGSAFARLRLGADVDATSVVVGFDAVRVAVPDVVESGPYGPFVHQNITADLTLDPTLLGRHYHATSDADLALNYSSAYTAGSWFMLTNRATTVAVDYGASVDVNGSGGGAGSYAVPAGDTALFICVGETVAGTSYWEARTLS